MLETNITLIQRLIRTVSFAGIFLFMPTLGLSTNLPGESFDFNFDGNMDYRILTIQNGKLSRFDVFIYDSKLGKHIKDETLSGLIFPHPDPKTKRVLSIATGGQSGALFSGEAYKWNGEGFDFEFSVKQEAVVIEGQIHYIRVKAKLVDGKPLIVSVEPSDPEWDDKGGNIE